jgi:hypothetical protein
MTTMTTRLPKRSPKSANGSTIAEIAYSKGDLRKLRQALEEAQATLEEGLA